MMLPTPVYITAGIGFLLGIQFGFFIAAMNTVFMGLVAWAICGFRLTSSKTKPEKTEENISHDPATISSQKNSGFFVIKVANNAPMTIAEYSQAVIGWACQAFPPTLSSILETPDQSPAMEKIRKFPFPLELQLIALHSAIYWTYALSILKISGDIIYNLDQGLEIGLSELRDSKGAPFDANLKEIFRTSFKAYLSAQARSLSDIEDDNSNIVSQSFFHILHQVYRINPEQLEIATRLHLGYIIDNLTPMQINIFMNDIGISFKNMSTITTQQYS